MVASHVSTNETRYSTYIKMIARNTAKAATAGVAAPLRLFIPLYCPLAAPSLLLLFVASPSLARDLNCLADYMQDSLNLKPADLVSQVRPTTSISKTWYERALPAFPLLLASDPVHWKCRRVPCLGRSCK